MDTNGNEWEEGFFVGERLEWYGIKRWCHFFLASIWLRFFTADIADARG